MEVAELANKLVAWIGEQVSRAGCRGTVVGLSGGIDSAVVAVLCQRAFPDDNLAAIIPCHSSQQDIDDALLVARRFHIVSVTVSLDEASDCLLRAIPPVGPDPARERLAQANVKPRLRMTALYYLANRFNYLVVGTGNFCERTIGYFTKYGDGGVDIMPLGNLVKRQVRELAQHLGIPAEIIDKAPSAGLWSGQTDEADMGLTYEELDTYLLTGQGSEDLKRKVKKMKAASAHKRALPPVAPV
ncbi:MAG: NAD(+) synthase [Chloroflexi bacterium]|nr:NAD(+) synthase [Chloroflexota bacterium]